MVLMFPVSYRDLELMLLDRGVYESCETGWRRLVARSDIDLIDIAAPNDVHAEIALAAAAAGKMVMCEKPLGRNAAEAASMAGAVERAQVPNMVWYNYRRVPAVVLAKQLIDEGRLGRIYHYRAKFLQDWTISQDLPQGGSRALASRCERRRQRRDGRPASALYRHRVMAQRRHRSGRRDDRNLH
jgi:predicted dehydrogenase